MRPRGDHGPRPGDRAGHARTALIASLGASQVVEFTAADGGARGPAARPAGRRRAAAPTTGLQVLHVDRIGEALPALLAACSERGVRLDSLQTRQATLEDVFVHLTGTGPAR